MIKKIFNNIYLLFKLCKSSLILFVLASYEMQLTTKIGTKSDCGKPRNSLKQSARIEGVFIY